MPDLNPNQGDAPPGSIPILTPEYLANLQRLVNALSTLQIQWGSATDSGLKIAEDFSNAILVLPPPGSSSAGVDGGGIDLTRLRTRTVALCNPTEVVQLVIQG